VLREAEDGGSLRGVVASDSLEDGVTVMQRMGENVDPSVVPIDETTIEPNLLQRANADHGEPDTN